MTKPEPRLSSLSPTGLVLLIIGVGALAAAVIGVAYGLIIDDLPRGVGHAGTVVMVVAAIVAIYVAYSSQTKRRI